MSPAVVPSYALVDHDGNAVTEQTFLGKYQLVFFGFTHCRMVCPQALAKLSKVLDDLGPLTDLIQPLHISVDPERDTPEVMRAFLATDYPRFLGLTGSAEATEDARTAFRVYAGRAADPDDPDGYAVPHTAVTYLLDPDADYLAHFPDVLEAAEITDRIRELHATRTG